MRAIRFFTAAALVLVATTASAQGGQGGMGQGGQGGMGQGGAQRMNEMLFKDITLTDAQKAQIDTIQTKGREEQRAMMQGGAGMQDPAMREKMMEMRKKQNDAIRAVLTAEQQAIFDKNLAAMPQGGGRRPPPQR
ncbi:MAG: Spy/CpxP family protein refolding chaperone [Gemmatimonadetes bacterium]|nr:Spy/CpxP family protein refolding chaperone [Gemmatimonadota bacterium]